MEECRMRAISNWVLRRIFGPEREEVTLTRYSCVMMYFTSHTPPQILRRSSRVQKGRECSMHGGKERFRWNSGQKT
jgi:hypothetical protein